MFKATFLKGRVQRFSIQVVVNKRFLLILKKILVQIRLIVLQKNAKRAHFNSKFQF